MRPKSSWTLGTCSHSGREKLKRHLGVPTYQTIQTINPKEIGISLGISCWERKRCQPQEKLVSLKEMLHSPNNFSFHPYQRRQKDRQWWVTGGQDHSLTLTAWMCIIFGALLKRLISVQGPKDRLGGVHWIIPLFHVATKIKSFSVFYF